MEHAAVDKAGKFGIITAEVCGVAFGRGLFPLQDTDFSVT